MQMDLLALPVVAGEVVELLLPKVVAVQAVVAGLLPGRAGLLCAPVRLLQAIAGFAGHFVVAGSVQQWCIQLLEPADK